MAIGMRARVTVYEVRCPRCDVSFPVETRKCIHCGGPTTTPADADSEASDALADFGLGNSGYADSGYANPSTFDPMRYGTSGPSSSTGYRGGDGEDRAVIRAEKQRRGREKRGVTFGTGANGPTESGSDAPSSFGGSRGGPFGGAPGDGRSRDPELETEGTPKSVLGSLVQSLGGIIWVLLLIGFSLARSCGD